MSEQNKVSKNQEVNDMENLKELVIYIAKSLVDSPEKVEVREVAGEQTSVLELKVAQEDLGKIIGKQGKTAKSIRIILSAAAALIVRAAALTMFNEENTMEPVTVRILRWKGFKNT